MGIGIIDSWKVPEAGDLVSYALKQVRTGEFTFTRKTGKGTEPLPQYRSVRHAARPKIIADWRAGALPEQTEPWTGLRFGQ